MKRYRYNAHSVAKSLAFSIALLSDLVEQPNGYVGTSIGVRMHTECTQRDGATLRPIEWIHSWLLLPLNWHYRVFARLFSIRATFAATTFHDKNVRARAHFLSSPYVCSRIIGSHFRLKRARDTYGRRNAYHIENTHAMIMNEKSCDNLIVSSSLWLLGVS